MLEIEFFRKCYTIGWWLVSQPNVQFIMTAIRIAFTKNVHIFKYFFVRNKMAQSVLHTQN